MPTTSRGLRYPASSSAPNVPQDIQNLASDVNTKLLFPSTAVQRSTWTAQSYTATNNYNLATLTINPNVGRPYIACIHTGGVFVVGASTNASLRINITGTGIVSAARLTSTMDSAQAVRFHYVADGASISVQTNLEVLAGTVGTFSDVTHSYLEAFAIPI